MGSLRERDTTDLECPLASDATRAFCFLCGYDLYGLELPRACPECGHVRNPGQDEEDGRKWFARTQSTVRWFVRPSKAPPGLCYVLYDRASAKVARRRRFLWLWLPAILTSVVVLFGVWVAVEHEVKIWYYDRSDPERKPLRTVYEMDTDRLFCFSFHFLRGGLFFRQPASWVQVTERTRRRWSFALPRDVDPGPLVWWAGAPWFVLLFGYVPARLAIRWQVRGPAASQRRPELMRATQVCSALTAPALGAAMWLWLGALVNVGLCQAFLSNEALGDSVSILAFLVPLAVWFVAPTIVWPMFVVQDRARRVFPHPLWVCLALIGITIVGPVVASWGLFRISA